MPDEITPGEEIVDSDDLSTEPETPTEEPEGGWAKYWEDHAKGLRKEAAKYRTRAKEVESKYAVFADERTQPFLAAAQAIAAGETSVVGDWMVRNAAAALGVDVDVLQALAAGDEETIDDVSDDTGLSPETIQRMVQEQIQAAFEQQGQAQTEAQTAAIESQAQQMGYEVGSRDYMNLLYVATHETDGDLDAAHEAIEAERQKVIDEYLDGKRREALGHTRQTGGQPPGTAKKIKLEDAADAAMERLARAGQ